MKRWILLICLFISGICFAQSGIVSGVLTEDSGPLPFANIVIKGTNQGTQTDFDGNYSIACEVGDILVISFVGFTTREVVVTPEMFDLKSVSQKPIRIAVTLQKTTAYAEAVQRQADSLSSLPSLGTTSHTYNKKSGGYNSFYRIKNIETYDDRIKLTYFKPDIYIEGAYTGAARLRYIRPRNLPQQGTTLFQTIPTTDQNVRLSIWSEKMESSISSNLGIGKDLYNQTTNSALSINGFFKTKRPYSEKWSHEVKVTYSSTRDRLANINGFQNLLFHNQFIPTNNSFNTTSFLLENNQSTLNTSGFNTAVATDYHINNHLTLYAIGTLHLKQKKERYAAAPNTLIYDNGYTSEKNNEVLDFTLKTAFKTDFDLADRIGITTNSDLRFNHSNLDYRFNENNGGVLFVNPRTLSKSIFEFKNNATIDYDNFLFLNLSAFSFVSSFQENNLFVPQASISFDPSSAFWRWRTSFFNYWNVSFKYGNTIADSPLFYSNYSHNALTLQPEDALSFSNRLDLFGQSDLKLERRNIFEVDTELRIVNHRISFGFNYTYQENSNGIFPMLNQDTFQLINAANSISRSVDFELSSINLNRYNNGFEWNTSLTFSRQRTEITKLLTSLNQIPVSGFATINTNLIEGESAGVIVGSNFVRGASGDILLNNNGSPLVTNTPEIIGDPTPDFKLGLTNSFHYKRFFLNVTLDYQKGGDVWDGTVQRIQNGNPAAAFIEDGSYLNLKSIDASFELVNTEKYKNKSYRPFFSSVKLNLFATNLFTWAAYQGATPYNAFFDGSGTQGLNFFNTPIITETGIKIIAKI